MIKKHYHIVLAAALFIGSCFFFSSCENDLKEVQSIGKGKENVEEGFEITSLLSLGGVIKAQLEAPYMLRRENDSAAVIFPRALFVTFYRDSTTIAESFLTAKYGKYFVQDAKVFLKDSVRFYNIKGDTMKTTELWWDQNTQEIYTDKPIWFYQKIPFTVINGSGFRAKQDFSSYYFTEVYNSQMSVADTTLPGQ